MDVEPYASAPKVLDLAGDVFSSLELAQLATLTGQDVLNRALSLWTLKEAFIKATGLGIALPMTNFSFLFDIDGAIHLKTDTSGQADAQRKWTFYLLDHASHRIAIAVERMTIKALRLWERRDFTSTPVPLSLKPAIQDR